MGMRVSKRGRACARVRGRACMSGRVCVGVRGHVCAHARTHARTRACMRACMRQMFEGPWFTEYRHLFCIPGSCPGFFPTHPPRGCSHTLIVRKRSPPLVNSKITAWWQTHASAARLPLTPLLACAPTPRAFPHLVRSHTSCAPTPRALPHLVRSHTSCAPTPRALPHLVGGRLLPHLVGGRPPPHFMGSRLLKGCRCVGPFSPGSRRALPCLPGHPPAGRPLEGNSQQCSFALLQQAVQVCTADRHRTKRLQELAKRRRCAAAAAAAARPPERNGVCKASQQRVALAQELRNHQRHVGRQQLMVPDKQHRLAGAERQRAQAAHDLAAVRRWRCGEEHGRH
eukprot:357488-Chlamydomonas_euryale.AAC.11